MSEPEHASVREHLRSSIWGGYDPFDGFPISRYPSDLSGWSSQHEYLTRSIEEVRPSLVVEIGVWKGASSIFMASKIKELGLNAAVLAIDTWLGSVEHWLDEEWRSSLAFESGRPSIMMIFMKNVLEAKLDGVIVPLPLDSLNAVGLLRARALVPDIIHLDGGHDYKSVLTDLEAWWPLLRPGGFLIGDDYGHEGGWPEVRLAFDAFFGTRGLSGFEFGRNKCRIRKPLEAAGAALPRPKKRFGMFGR